VWGLEWFGANVSSIVPTHATDIGAPDGVPFYYSSPLLGWLHALLGPVFGLRLSFAFGIMLARIATVLCAYGAARSLELKPTTSLIMAAVYGCSPYFHGFAVEGIIEGTNGWTLPLWVWMSQGKRWFAAVFAAALVVLSSWYLALCGVLIACALLPFRWRASATFFAGVALSSPAIWLFFSTFTGGSPLDPGIRASMGANLSLFPTPGSMAGLSYSAKTTWIGWVAGGLALLSVKRHPRWAIGALLAFILSLGWGPLYSLPLWRVVRFPYRIHAITLLAIGFLASKAVEMLATTHPNRLTWLAPALAAAITLEGLFLSPVEPIIPGSSAEVPSHFRDLRGQNVLSMPGPVAMPPGVINPSRRRAQYLLYWPAVAQTRTPWIPDFNGVGIQQSESEVLEKFRSWDHLINGSMQALTIDDFDELSIASVVIHLDHLDSRRATTLATHLTTLLGPPSSQTPSLIIFSIPKQGKQ